jgi:hypothetical protein
MYLYIATESFNFSFNLYLKHAIDYQIAPSTRFLKKYYYIYANHKSVLVLIYAIPYFHSFIYFILSNHKSGFY